MAAVAIGLGISAASLGAGLAADMGAFGGPSGTSSIKNPGIQGANDSMVGGLVTDQARQKSDLSQYISRYLAGYPTAAKNTAQETGSVDQYYNGDAAQQLSSMRASRTKALMDATNRASQYALANNNRSMIGMDGVGSSYGQRMLQRNIGDIQTSAAVDNANQQRTDWGTVNNAQINLLGKRRALTDSLAQYGLQPDTIAQSIASGNANLLNTLSGTNNANGIYGLQSPTTGQGIGSALNSAGELVNRIGSVFGVGRDGVSAGGSMLANPSYSPSGYNAFSSAASSSYMPMSTWGEMSNTPATAGQYGGLSAWY